jgi:hypothetical protein
MAEEARSLPKQTCLVYELACKGSQRVLWPRKVELYSTRHDYLDPNGALQLLIFAVYEV